MKLTQKLLKEQFDYENGNLVWKFSKGGAQKNQSTGSKTNNGYLMSEVNGNKTNTHRLIFLWHHGYLPKTVDHINGNNTDNRIENLRDASRSQNQCNRTIPKHNKSGVKGVCWCKRSKKWRVQVIFEKQQKFSKYFEDIELAELVAIEARNNYHGQFANHGGGYVPAVTYPFGGKS